MHSVAMLFAKLALFILYLRLFSLASFWMRVAVWSGMIICSSFTSLRLSSRSIFASHGLMRAGYQGTIENDADVHRCKGASMVPLV